MSSNIGTGTFGASVSSASNGGNIMSSTKNEKTNKSTDDET
jgi:hypothetical protein